jgi:hypothetical protein
MQPSRRSVAPVNAPFSRPKSSEAIKGCGIAAQLTRINGRFARRERLCMARATSPFPGAVLPANQHRRIRGCDLREVAQSGISMIPNSLLCHQRSPAFRGQDCLPPNIEFD